MKNDIRVKISEMKSGKRSLGFRVIAVLMLICMIFILASCDDVASAPAKKAKDSASAQAEAADKPAAAENDSGVVTSAVDIPDLANQVIAGKWGNGQARVNALKAAGYDASAVQEEVDTILQKINSAAQEVIAGKWGNGQARVNALTNAGYDAKAVQSKVNDLMNAAQKTSVDTGTDTDSASAEDNTDSGSQVTWHDEITEPIYEQQPVYKYNYMYTFTAVITTAVSPQVTNGSDYIYDTAEAAEFVANGYSAQTAALNTIRAAGYDAYTLADCTYTITTSSKQTGTKRVQTGTRIVQQAGWY